MWLKVLEFVLSSGSYLYSFWTKIRQKQAIEAEIKQEQEKVDDKAIQTANSVRGSAIDDPNLLLAPKDRAPNNID